MRQRPTNGESPLSLTVATCQFPVDADIGRNGRYVRRQMRHARESGADIVHFPEACLSGYAGTDFSSYAGFDWEQLEKTILGVIELAADLGLWVVLGSTHRLTADHKPRNSVYVIDDTGAIVDRYDKRFLGGDPDERSGDLLHYSPGDHFSVFTVNGVRCGVQICYDYRFPELYRQYKGLGVQMMFHSFHAAHASAARFAAMRAAVGTGHPELLPGSTATYPGITMPAAMTAAAANNFMWISAANSSAPQSCWPAFFVRADGVTTGRLHRNVAGVLITEVDTEADLYNSAEPWRDRAMAGILHSGTLVDDPRSSNRVEL